MYVYDEVTTWPIVERLRQKVLGALPTDSPALAPAPAEPPRGIDDDRPGLPPIWSDS